MRQIYIALAGAGSAALLLGALAFQYIGGLYPCPYCMMQRWPHLVAVLIAVAALALRRLAPGWLLPLAGAAAALTTAAIGLFHTGVERGWVQGSSSCTTGGVEGLTPEQVLQQLQGKPLANCDQVAWEMLGLSMASWNAVISLGLVALWLLAAARSRRTA